LSPKKLLSIFKNENYDIVTLSFKKIKKLKENTFYVEVGEKIIQIYSEKTSLISDKNLIIKRQRGIINYI
jgi:hypothetical protein